MRTSPRFGSRPRIGAFAAALALVFASAACGARLPSIRLEGTPADLSRLVGTWTGEYIGDTSLDAVDQSSSGFRPATSVPSAMY
jgi:hypothetical protein